MSVKRFFNRLFGRTQTADKSPVPVPEAQQPKDVKTVSVHRNAKSHVVVRHSCRERRYGAKRADGRWQSPFDVWLLKKQGMDIGSIRRVFGRPAVNWAMAR